MNTVLVNVHSFREVRLNKHGYTSSGEYYGIGSRLYVAEIDGVGGTEYMHVRGADRKSAWENLKHTCARGAKEIRYASDNGEYVRYALQMSKKPSRFTVVNGE